MANNKETKKQEGSTEKQNRLSLFLLLPLTERPFPKMGCRICFVRGGSILGQL
jgi:hypothetical protein